MKKFVKSIVGATLLEIMLVLAIAAMIIVMSIRYYQSANASQQVNTLLGQVTSIVAAADSLAQASGSYSAAGVTTATIQALVPTNSMRTPWGTDITVTPVAASSFTINIPAVPGNVCPLIRSKLGANNHFTAITPAACPAAATNMTTVYLSNP